VALISQPYTKAGPAPRRSFRRLETGPSFTADECILRPVTIPWRSAPEGFIGGNALANGLTRSSLKIV
jgi:hypothetical protein